MEFNPDCRIEVRQLHNGSALVVVDDALRDPEMLVRLASEQLPKLVPDDRWQYPGIEVALAQSDVEPYAKFLRRHIRDYFGVSRVVREAYARLSMVTLAPEQLNWSQRMCHIDGVSANPGERSLASVLYLFRDSDLGGTCFFQQRADVPHYLQMFQDGRPGPGSEKFDFFQQPPAYHTDSNEFYQLDQFVEARWNRMIFYRGDTPHSAHIISPDRLSNDPLSGRLTLNGFYRMVAIGP
ncbi:MAG: DUF6445 family protein [Gammaproteobacteria bacterium]